MSFVSPIPRVLRALRPVSSLPATSTCAGPSRSRLASRSTPSLRPLAYTYSSDLVHAINLSNQSRRWLSTTPLSHAESGKESFPPVTVHEAEGDKGESIEDEGNRIAAPSKESKSQVIGQIEPRLQMTFTCTANDCGHRSTHEFARKSYEKGIVIVQCPSCKSRHLIADHLGWFNESTENGTLRTVEDLVRAKGEQVRRGRVGMDGDIEYFE